VESWIFREPERFRQEREAIETLKRAVDWLVVADWNIEGDGLCVDAVIRAHGHDYELRLLYPHLFPHVPPIVRPRNAEGRWSTHQYVGPNGVLCLEYRSDNWRPEITGAQMLESAHRLVDIENPLGENRPERPVIAPSAHQLTLGQEVRNEWARWYLSESFERFLAAQPVATGSFKFSLRNPNDNWIILIHEAAPLSGDTWQDVQIPACIPEATASDLWDGVWLNAPSFSTATIKAVATLDALRKISLEAGQPPELFATDGTSPVTGFNRAIRAVLIRDGESHVHFFISLSKPNVTRCTPIRSERSSTKHRIPEGQSLAGKSIGIVGLGSAGSKLAVSLARTGARKFYLVDHELFFPENIVRNALDWQAVGEHKVDAAATALQLVAPDVQVSVSRTHLTGQESSASVSLVLN
jgi:sulfur-carrier protein adenylyltransferase/sulfurtransferase